MAKVRKESVQEKPEQALAPEQIQEENVDREESPAKAAFRAHIAQYAKQSPKKYAFKKDELQKKLDAIA